MKVSVIRDQQTGKITVLFNVTMGIRNSSSLSNSIVTERAGEIKFQMEQSFSGYDSKTNKEYRTMVTFDSNETNYVMDFVDKISGNAAGRVDKIGDTNNNTMKVLLEKGMDGNPLQSNSETTRTGAHEYGHTLGLQHGETGELLKSKTEPNLMNQSQYTTSTTVNTDQLNKAENTVLTNELKQIEQQKAIDELNKAGRIFYT